jgi:hypothetical protein
MRRPFGRSRRRPTVHEITMKSPMALFVLANVGRIFRQVNERDRPTSVRWRRELDGYDMWRKQDDDNEHWPATRASTGVA